MMSMGRLQDPGLRPLDIGVHMLLQRAAAVRQVKKNTLDYLICFSALDCVPGAWEALGSPTEGFLHISSQQLPYSSTAGYVPGKRGGQKGVANLALCSLARSCVHRRLQPGLCLLALQGARLAPSITP